jgi:hypothetical protein
VDRGRIEAVILLRDKEIPGERTAGELGETKQYAEEAFDFFVCVNKRTAARLSQINFACLTYISAKGKYRPWRNTDLMLEETFVSSTYSRPYNIAIRDLIYVIRQRILQ